jgi:hypothetical protein
MTPKYKTLWELYGPKPRRGRPPGRAGKVLARDLVIFNVYWKIAHAHPDWPITRQCKETHKKLTGRKGFETLPERETVRRIVTGLRKRFGIS